MEPSTTNAWCDCVQNIARGSMYFALRAFAIDRGGPHQRWNLATLCSAHHRQLHEGQLLIVGRAPHGLQFTWPMDPTRTSTRTCAWTGNDGGRVSESDAAAHVGRALADYEHQATRSDQAAHVGRTDSSGKRHDR